MNCPHCGKFIGNPNLLPPGAEAINPDYAKDNPNWRNAGAPHQRIDFNWNATAAQPLTIMEVKL